MKKTLFFAMATLAAACTLASCQRESTPEQVEPAVTAEAGAVGFDTYVNRATTKAGAAGTLTTAADHSVKLQGTGFGVFAYYTDNNAYEGLTIPNFMYNQQIEYNTIVSGKWGYNPVKYWPNEYGSSAIADDNDKVSFFAYAPWVVNTPSTGKVGDADWGIAGFSRNSATGDPYVKYIASFDGLKSVDLCWGVVPNEATSTKWNIVSGAEQTLAAGLPWLDVERPLEAATQESAAQRVKFDFKHALAKLNVVVDYDADATTHDETNVLAADITRIYIRSVSFTGFSMKGALNLNNVEANVPLWMSFDATGEIEPGEETTINDGRKDGMEGATSAPTEKNVHLNPALTQAGDWNNDNKGVQKTYSNLFAFPGADKVAADMKLASPTKSIDMSGIGIAQSLGVETSNAWDYTESSNATAILSWPVMVIPNGEEMTITIVYDVETKDQKLATLLSDGKTAGSSIENRITKTITFPGAKNYMEAGKKYTVKLHLGMNSVKFDANVTEWNTPAVQAENWFPENITSFQAPGVYNYNVAAATTATSAFQVTGFAPGESIKNEVVSPVSGGVDLTAGADGKVLASTAYSITANNSVLNVTTPDAIKLTGNVSGKTISLTLVQAAAQPAVKGTPANDSAIAFTNDSDEGIVTFRDGDSATSLTGDVWTGETRNVTILSATRNGVAMTEVGEGETPDGTLQFKAKTNGIKLGSKALTDETFVFVIQAGDAQPVTLVCEVS